MRNWFYVEEHCYAIDLIIRKDKVRGVYNIGGHNEKTILEVVKIIIKKLDWILATKLNDGIKKTIN